MNGSDFAAAVLALPVHKSADTMISEKNSRVKYLPSGKPATYGMLKLLAFRLTKKGFKVSPNAPSALHPAEFQLLRQMRTSY